MSAAVQIDRASQHRRGMLAKVHIAKAQLRLSDDDYVAVLLRVSGRTSAADCSDGELDDVLKEFAVKGFTAKAKGGARPLPISRRPADHASAGKARALWISLHHLCAIDDPSEKALEAFARRQLGCAQLQWADQALAYKLIEALKAIGERHGWNAEAKGVKPEARIITLKLRLVIAIIAKLLDRGMIPAGWTVARVARELTGIEIVSDLLATTEELDRIARALGAKLRATGGAA